MKSHSGQKQVKIKKSTASRIFDACNIILMILFCITILIPFWDMIVRSFSRAQDISYMHINFFPKVWTLSAYEYCLQNNEIMGASFVSVARTVCGSSGSVSSECNVSLPPIEVPHSPLLIEYSSFLKSAS